MTEGLTPEQILRWHIEAGADEAIGERPIDRFALPAARPVAETQRGRPSGTSHPVTARPATTFTQSAAPKGAPVSQSAQLAQACATLDALKKAIEAYDGCALKRTCQRTVFSDGNPKARVMLIGEAPGREEDEQGLPFVGPSGKLLDRMLASIGLDRDQVYITNVIYWRPPGNRKPEPSEVDQCLPFMERQIELIDPAVMMFLGGAAAAAILGKTEGVTKLRGRWHDYSAPGLQRPIPALPTYHPAYLLRTPIHKREAWRDLVTLRKRLSELSIGTS
ncbi:MAG TPA: uracil-DNA glycosylase [Magnetospirillaceae bacterium]|jgi:DNA polymerase